MKPYAFILGREYKLSLAEISRVLRAEGKEFAIEQAGEDVAIIRTDHLSSELFHRLGGSIKMAEVQKVKRDELESLLDKRVREKLGPQKIYVGLSVYGLSDDVDQKQLERLNKEVRAMLFEIKSCLKEEQQSFRFVESKQFQLSSVVVEKNHLVSDRGIEFLLLADGEELWLGQTMAVQDFEAFSARDFARPFRDDRSGMLPPKLARMMLNLAGISIDEETVVLDPFCGSGTVLQEAALLGAGKVLGSDLSKKAVMDTLGNLSWLKKEFRVKTESSVEQVDVEDLRSWVPQNFVDLIVTEPYLGEPVRKKLPQSEVSQRQKNLALLYDKALVEFHHVLKPGGMAVMVFPFIGTSRLPLPRHLDRLFERIDLGENLVSTDRLGIDYQRPDQHVGREIMILRRKDR